MPDVQYELASNRHEIRLIKWIGGMVLGLILIICSALVAGEVINEPFPQCQVDQVIVGSGDWDSDAQTWETYTCANP